MATTAPIAAAALVLRDPCDDNDLPFGTCASELDVEDNVDVDVEFWPIMERSPCGEGALKFFPTTTLSVQFRPQQDH